jgi:hypothetical protein
MNLEDRCLLGAQHAADYLTRRFGGDDLPAPTVGWVDSCHKVLACLQITGRIEHAARVAGWIAENGYRDGELGSANARTEAFAPFRRYTDAWTMLGLHRIGRYDLSYPLAATIASAQQPDGWFVSDPTGGPRICDLWVSAAAAWGLLGAGRVDPARALCRNFVARLDEIPADGTVTIAFGLDDAGQRVVEADDLRREVVVRPGRQNYHTPGIIAMLLARTAAATGDSELVEAAERWLVVAERFMPEPARYGTGGKVGWGAALVWQLTGSDRSRRLAEAVLGYLLETQAGDGQWPREDPLVEVDTVAEFGFLLAEAALALRAPLHRC